MKVWAWILGGVGVTAGAWWYLKGRNPVTAATPKSIYPEGVVPGVTPGYPVAPSVDQLPSDPAQQMAPAMGEPYASTTQSSSAQASTVSAGYGEPTTNSSSSSGATYAVGTGTGTNTPSPTTSFFSVKPYSPPSVVRTPYVRPTLSSSRPKPKAKTVVVAPMVASKSAPTVAPMMVDSMAAPRPIVSLPSPVVAPAPVVVSRPETAPVSAPTPSSVTSLLRPVAASTASIAPAPQLPKVALPGDVQTTAPLPSPVVSLLRPVAPTPSPVVTPKPIVSSPRPVVAPQPTKVTVTTYKSPVTSSTRTVVAPVVVAPKVVAPVMTKSPAPRPLAVTPLTRPVAVVRPTQVRGVYAVGADFTEAEYRAMAVKAELESRRREWAANQMAEQTNAMNRVNR